MYSVCILIYLSIKLPIYTRYIWTGCGRWLRAIRGAPENEDLVNPEICSEAVIKRVSRYTWRLWSCEFGDALGGRDRASLEMHLEAVIERMW